MALNNMENFIQEKIPEVYNICLYQNGNILYDRYYQSYSYPEYAVNIKSVSKILLTLAVGVMLKENLIKGVNTTVVELLPEYEVSIPKEVKNELKLKHLLTMTSGFIWQESGQSFFKWLKSDDWVSHLLECPRGSKPGTTFQYNTANSHLISAIVKRQTGKNAYTFISEYILKPLGIFHAMWQKSPEGNDYGGGDFFISPKDIIKIGQLILQKGNWRDSELLPKGFVSDCLKPYITVNHELVYGYLCFGKRIKTLTQKKERIDIEAWFIPGTGGQYLYIIPQLNATVVITSVLIPNDDRDPNSLPAGRLLQQFIIEELYNNFIKE